MTKLKFTPPGPNAPGFLRRNRTVIRLFRGLDEVAAGKNPNFAWLDQLYIDIVEFLLPYVEMPADRDEARAALEDASENDFKFLLRSVVSAQTDAGSEAGLGGVANPTNVIERPPDIS